MNKELREFFDNNKINIKKITIKGKVKIIENEPQKLVIKKRTKDLKGLYKYLNSRSFSYFPPIIYSTLNYDIYQYINNTDLPIEEKAEDIIKLISILHQKTTYYKDIDDNTYKELYENTIEKLNYLNNYYNDIAELIESEEFMSPSNYLFIRNISKIFQALNYCKINIEKWYKIIEEKKRIRIVTIHNNLDLNHYLLDKKPYLISWQKSKKDLPIYDLINFYKKYYKELDFYNLLKLYENNYPLLKEEKILLFILISIPEKVEFNNNIYNMCITIGNFYNYIQTTEKLITDYFPKQT